MSGGATNKDTSSTPNSTDNGSVVQQPQVHAKHDILVWFEVLELGKSLILMFENEKINYIRKNKIYELNHFP